MSLPIPSIGFEIRGTVTRALSHSDESQFEDCCIKIGKSMFTMMIHKSMVSISQFADNSKVNKNAINE
jgi:hypothetical protein